MSGSGWWNLMEMLSWTSILWDLSSTSTAPNPCCCWIGATTKTVAMMASNVSATSCTICCMHVESTLRTPRKMSKHGCSAREQIFTSSWCFPILRHFATLSHFCWLRLWTHIRERKLAKEHDGTDGTRTGKWCRRLW